MFHTNAALFDPMVRVRSRPDTRKPFIYNSGMVIFLISEWTESIKMIITDMIFSDFN